LKNFDVQEEKIDKELHSNIHRRSNVTTIESTINKENYDVGKRINIMKNIKLNGDVTPWKKEKNKNYK